MSNYSELRSLPRVGNPSSTRDSQKSKVYKAESILWSWRSPHHLILLTDTKTDSFGQKNPSIKAAQDYVDHLCAQRWFQSRWGQRHIEVRLKVYGSATGYHGGHICLPPWARNEQVILHEVAHTLLTSSYAPHGPEFAAVLLTLVENHMGKHIAAALRESYATNKVKYRNGLAVVPKPRSRAVITKAKKLAISKERQAKNIAWATRASTKQEAAQTIRLSVKAGLFGPSGSKPRTHALATARLLEKT